MKCICGYIHEDGIDDSGNWQDFLEGDERFVKIEGNHFHIEDSCSYVRDKREVHLYACPKCKTIQMKEGF